MTVRSAEILYIVFYLFFDILIFLLEFWSSFQEIALMLPFAIQMPEIVDFGELGRLPEEFISLLFEGLDLIEIGSVFIIA